jgi:hypothetical protein
MFGTLMRLWAWYAGEQSSINKESGIHVNDSLINKPLGASEMAQLVNLYSQGLMSRLTVLQELQRGGALDPDLLVEKEIERIKEDKEEKMQNMPQMMPAEEPEQEEMTEQEKVEQAAKVAQ